MDTEPSASATDLLADVIALVTLGLGTGLTVSPVHVGRYLGLGTVPARGRVVGILDLAVGAALLTSGRQRAGPRWPWLVAREGLHVVIANEYRRLGNSAGVLAMAGLFGADGVATVLMIRQEVGARVGQR